MITRTALFGALVLAVFSIIYSVASTIALENRTEKIESMIAEYEKKYDSECYARAPRHEKQTQYFVARCRTSGDDGE